jgi:hypothetical protein
MDTNDQDFLELRHGKWIAIGLLIALTILMLIVS